MNFQIEEGFITNGSPHGGLTPNEIFEWHYDSTEFEGWMFDSTIKITAEEIERPSVARRSVLSAASRSECTLWREHRRSLCLKRGVLVQPVAFCYREFESIGRLVKPRVNNIIFFLVNIIIYIFIYIYIYNYIDIN